MELRLLFCVMFVIINKTSASDIDNENLEKRIEHLEQYIQNLEANLVKK